MANIFEQYGIKEVADVTIYKFDDDGNPVPFLFLDTLKVSTIEQTAEQSDARGGKGNSKLITWDYGKEINVTLEDALYSPASMALMWSGKVDKLSTATATIEKLIRYTPTGNTIGSTIKDGDGKTWNVAGYVAENGKFFDTLPTTVTAGQSYTLKVTTAATDAKSIVIEADDFPGTYKIVGDTYARNRDTGIDEYFQFIIHRAKMSAEQTLTLEAEGDPSTFNLNLTVLRPTDGKMMELIQYTL